MPRISIETQIDFTRKYVVTQKLYEIYARTLKEVLEAAVNIYAPYGIVQVRKKSVSSFTEKLLRKDRYIDPLVEITDLCGARVICHFESQVKKICTFIRQNFDIDELNSVDIASRLKASEPGNKSIHYIITPRLSKILGVHIPGEIRQLKAEIQVRTFNEHIRDDIFYDRIHKTPVVIPIEWKQKFTPFTLFHENADEPFRKMSATIDQVNVNYIPTPSPGRAKSEIEILTALLDINPEGDDKSTEYRLRLAQIYISGGEWQNAINTLMPVKDTLGKIKNPVLKACVKYELGFALCYSGEFLKGVESITKAIEMLTRENNTRNLSKAWFYMGKIRQHLEIPDVAAIRQCYDRAYSLFPENPYLFISHLWTSVFAPGTGEKPAPDLISPEVQKCMEVCSEHVEMGIEVIPALFTIFKSAVIMSNVDLALNALIKAADMILNDKVIFSKDYLMDELKNIEAIASNTEQNQDCYAGILHLVLWKKYKTRDSENFLRKIYHSDANFNSEVIIIAGSAHKHGKQLKETWSPYITEALLDFEGTIISGGTNSGLPGMVGEMAEKMNKQDKKKFNLLGYLPGKLPNSRKRSAGYDRFVTSRTGSYSMDNVLGYWADILFQGIRPDNVLLFGIGGGSFALLEYKLALALGVKVALLKDSGGSVSEIINDYYWNTQPGLIILPEDPPTVWTLVNRNKPCRFTRKEINLMAIEIHKYYKQVTMQWFDANSENVNQFKAIMAWDLLDPKLKISNIKQAEFIEYLLARVGLGLRKSHNPVPLVIDCDFEHFELLARLEHSRWNAERLLSGWKPGSKKDIANKISPHIKQWELIDNSTREYDYNAVSKFPEMLKKIGYEVFNNPFPAGL